VTKGHLVVDSIFKSYVTSKNRPRIQVLSDLTFSVASGEFISLFGPNGCGKTTLLRLMAGLEQPDSGSIWLDERPPVLGRVGVIFQNYRDSLFPWLTAIDNVAYPLYMNGLSRSVARARAICMCEELGLSFDLKTYPYLLSGGQQQLVANARALAYNPEVLLMDEPFSSLDYETSIVLEDTLLEVWNKTRKTIIFVSHDIDEALYLADRLILLTRLPATVKTCMDIPFVRPRTQSIRLQPDYATLKQRSIDTFLEEVNR